MKNKTKKILWKSSKITWFIFGALLLSWTLLWFIGIHFLRNSNVLTGIILFVWGLVILGSYIIITILFLLIKWLIKKFKKKK